jgi:integrase/recombinase XerD
MPELSVVQPQAPAIARRVEEYLDSCRARGLSPKTVKLAYGYPLRGSFLPWCVQQGLTEPGQFSTRLLERYAAELLEHGGARGPLSKDTVWTYMKAVRGFLTWAKADGDQVDAEVRLPKLGRRVIDVLERDEVRRLEDVAGAERDKLIVRLLADTGVRVGELIKLRDQDLTDRDRKPFLRVRGKGDRERLVPISPQLRNRLRRYIERERPADANSDRIFVGRRRARSGAYEPLTESGVQQMVRELGERAGLRKRVHPHLFRHSAATYLLRQRMDSLQVAQVLGHTSLAMIQRVYSHLTPSDTHEALMRALREE